MNPLEAWTSSVTAATTATLELATAASSQTIAIWTAAFAPSNAVDAAPRIKPEASATVRPANETVFGWPIPTIPAATAPAASSSNRGRSWYKAPYRSPFDPMFWMSPGHPVDHIDHWMSLMRVAMAPLGASAAVMPTMPWPMFQLGAFPAFPTVPNFPTFPAFSTFPTFPTFPAFPSFPMFPAFTQPGADNVIDFSSAYSAFRTAGGHAAAQIVHAPPRRENVKPFAGVGSSNSQPATDAWDAMMRLYWPWLTSR